MTRESTTAQGTGAAAPVTRADSRPGPWKRGRVLAALAVLLGLVMLLHAEIPERRWNLGSLADTSLPWFGLFVPVLLAGALLRRSASAAVALLIPVMVWGYLFAGTLSDKSRPGGFLTVASENVNAGNPDPAGTARYLTASGADVLALEELTPQATVTYEKGLAKAYPYHAARGTVGLWSKLPLSGTRPVDVADSGPLGGTVPAAQTLPSNRALRSTVTTDHGPLTVYVAHLGSVRLNPRGGYSTTSRDIGVRALDQAIAADPSHRVMLLGDLNGSLADRSFHDLTSQLRSAQDVAGDGFGFTWPASFPVVRIDQILTRGAEPDRSWTLPANGSDHLPVAAKVSW
ncbi:MAG: endonuclease/exonuclease/phosphatase family protein [Streptosporangiales bacterium]|jgi:vancomycin resistance protein VanJ|nr:endonuclease/exonuclease/phosphatase family protein [Streptosporangiales bacterium]